MRFAYGGCKPANADAIAPHDGILQLAVLVKILHAHGFGIFGAELEDISNLNATGNAECVLAALGADPAFFYLGEIVERSTGAIPLEAEARVMVFLAVCAAAKVVRSLKRAVEQHRHALGQAERPDVAGHNAAFRRDGCRVDRFAEEIRELGLVCFQIAAQEQYDVFVRRIFLINNRLAGLFHRQLQERANVLDGLLTGRVYGCERSILRILFVFNDAFRRFHVRPPTAFRAGDDGVLAHRGKEHVFMGNAAAHHTRIGQDGHGFRDAGARKNALVCVIAAGIVLLQILL